MKPIILKTGICLLLALGLAVSTIAQGGDSNKAAAAHAAAVKRCRERRTAEERAAKDKSGAEQTAALAEAKKNYEDCIKAAAHIH